MTLQERMFLYRVKHNIGQKELANRCGLSLMTICNVENGIQKPSKMTAAKIMLVVGGSIDEIISKQNQNIQSVPTDVQVEVCGDVRADTESGSVGDGQ